MLMCVFVCTHTHTHTFHEEKQMNLNVGRRCRRCTKVEMEFLFMRVCTRFR